MLKRLAAALVRRVPMVRAVLRFGVARWGKPGVAAIIVRDRQVLLFQHVFWTSARWGLPGGGIEAGEEAAAAIRREVREECGLDIEIVRRLVTGSENRSTYFVCAAADVPRDRPVPRLSFEILAAEWFPHDRLPAGVLPSHARAIAAAFADT